MNDRTGPPSFVDSQLNGGYAFSPVLDTAYSFQPKFKDKVKVELKVGEWVGYGLFKYQKPFSYQLD